MEDALVLSTYLQTTNISVEDALKRYEAQDRVADELQGRGSDQT